jgi:hypothetical protein
MGLLNLLWRRTDDSMLARAALGAMVRQLGGSVVIPMVDLEDALMRLDEIEITKNDNPEGMRIFVRATKG